MNSLRQTANQVALSVVENFAARRGQRMAAIVRPDTRNCTPPNDGSAMNKGVGGRWLARFVCATQQLAAKGQRQHL